MKSDGSQLLLSFIAFQALYGLGIIISGVTCHEITGPSFSYNPHTRAGPHLWGQLHQNWTTCSYGRRQTPIDITDKDAKVNSSLGPLHFHYKPVLAEAFQSGHGIKVSIKGDGGSLLIDGKTYDLVQYHWHWPSEHTINGKRFDLELHLVHSNHHHGLAVVGVLFNSGHRNPLLKTMLSKFGNIGKEKLEMGMIDPWEITFKSPSYYRYIGSLTTPPCTEGVVWTIMSKIMEVSSNQLALFKKVQKHPYNSTARPIQNLDGRIVFTNKPLPLSSKI